MRRSCTASARVVLGARTVGAVAPASRGLNLAPSARSFYTSRPAHRATSINTSSDASDSTTTSSSASSPASNFTNQLPTYDDVKYGKLDSRRKRLLFRSKERGMLETDLILGSFAIKNLEGMNETQLVQFEEILDCIDPDLFMYLTKKVETPAELDNEVMHMIQLHTFNNPLNYDSTANRKLN